MITSSLFLNYWLWTTVFLSSTTNIHLQKISGISAANGYYSHRPRSVKVGLSEFGRSIGRGNGRFRLIHVNFMQTIPHNRQLAQ